jgi:hypothetical protein
MADKYEKLLQSYKDALAESVKKAKIGSFMDMKSANATSSATKTALIMQGGVNGYLEALD